jgi:hypothetical protein
MADIEKVAEDDPRRCQATNNQGQCRNKAVDGCSNCIAHGGARQDHSNKMQNMRNYRLTKWNARIQEKGDSSAVKSLRDEIGILRILMEERLQSCTSESDLILHSGPISDLVMKIERVVASCHKLEGAMGQLLDKQAILQFAAKVINILGEELVAHPEVVAKVADRIMESFNEG